MKVVLHRTDKIEVDLEWMAQAVVKDIQFNMKYGWRDPLKKLVEARFDMCSDFSYVLDDLELYDNYSDVLQTITNNMIIWCAENNTQFYDIIMEYKKYIKI